MKKKYTIKFIGLDVHKDTITIAIADDGRDGEVRLYGTINNDMDSLNKFLRKQISTGAELHFVYEAGPTGYGIYRYLTANGLDCSVVAPALIPKKSGDRIKNDKRDAISLARLHRSGELSPIYVPNQDDEAIRDLTRAREDAKNSTRKAKQRLQGFLLRHGQVYSGKTKWTKAHFNWLGDVKMPHPAQQIALQEYIDTINECSQRVSRLTSQLVELVNQWRMFPIVQALQALRGVSFLTATITVAEIGDLSRFSKASEVMAYLGLVPTEHSSGKTTKRGGITKAGSSHARRALVECSWTYRFPARVSRHLLKRHEGIPRNILKIAWKAQQRLCSRFTRLIAKGKPKQVVTTAIARELVGFIWAIAREVPRPRVKA